MKLLKDYVFPFLVGLFSVPFILVLLFPFLVCLPIWELGRTILYGEKEEVGGMRTRRRSRGYLEGILPHPRPLGL
jgi:hypothetical protein